ncbi:MAG: hypothetical protein ABEJ95_07425 [Candidatus Nanohalobium sp.]
MKKYIAVFTLFLLLPAAHSIETSYLDNYTVPETIRSFETSSNSDFSTLINTRNSINIYSKDGREYHEEVGETSFPTDFDTKDKAKFWLTGTKFPGRVILIKNSTKTLDSRIGTAIDYLSFTSTGNLFASIGIDKSYLLTPEGQEIWSKPFKSGLERLKSSRNIDGDGRSEKLIGTGEATLVFQDRKAIWRLEKTGFMGGKFIDNRTVLVWWEGGMSVRFVENGSAVWERETGAERFRPVILGERVVYLDGARLVHRDLETGEELESYRLDARATGLRKFPGKDWLVARQDDSLSIFTTGGKKLHSFETGGMDEGYQFTQYDSDSRKEIAYGDGKTVHIVDISGGKVSVNRSLGETVFVGTGPGMLEAVALNRTSFIARDFGEVREEVNKTGLKPLGVGEVSGLESTQSVNEAFNVSKPGYFAGSRDKAVYVAALAAKDNASLTFDRSEADRDFSNYTVEELQQRFVQEFRPHHVAVADLDSDRGVLAAYMAVRQGVLPVDFDANVAYPSSEQLGSSDFNASRWNRDNGVIKLDRKIEEAFEMIGENRNTVFDGKYVSLLDGPRRLYQDPVDKGFFDDSRDGSYFYSDLDYGDLDDDGRLEAGVGRYPSEVGDASAVYHRSLVRDSEKEAVLAGEYLHSRWPVILATFGGGMWDVKNLGYVLERQGFDIERVVEHRSKPVALITDLLGFPTKMDLFVGEVKTAQDQIGKYLGASGAAAVKNAAFMVRGLNYAERVLQMYLEFDWTGWQPLEQDIDVPDSASLEELRQAAFSFLPDRHRRLTQEALVNRMRGKDIIYLQLVGNSSGYTMPNNRSGFVHDSYSNGERVSAGELPEVSRAIVWDSAVNAGKRGSEIRKAFLENGASSYLGFSSVSYEAYSAYISRRFFRHGETLGESLEGSINDLRSAFIVYNPASAYRTGVREKMERSLSLYGNPEMPKDPIKKPELDASRSCEEGVCELEVGIDPEPRVVERGGRKQYVFNATDYLIQDLAPITPLYKYSRELPENATVVSKQVSYSYRNISGVVRSRNHLLSYSGRFKNSSFEGTFPEKVYRLNSSRVEYVQAAIQYRENSSRILEEASLTVRYRAPVTLELGKDGSEVVAEVFSSKPRNVSVAYSVDGHRDTQEVSLSEGPNTIPLENVSRGSHSVEAYIYRDELLAHAGKEIRFPRKLSAVVFAPDIHRGSVRKVRAVIENPNRFPVSRQIEIVLSDNLQLGFLETPDRELRLRPGEARRVSWRVTGIETGNSSASVMGSNDSLVVRPAFDLSQTISPSELFRSVSSPRSQFSVDRTSSGLQLRLETGRGHVTYRINSSHETGRLVTDSFTASIERTGERTIRKVETGKGSYTELTADGRETVASSGQPPANPEKKILLLERELDKLRERYQASEASMLNTNRKME